MTTYFGFAIADSMFGSFDGELFRSPIASDKVAGYLNARDIVPCVNPSHVATLNALRVRFGVEVAVPATAPKVLLQRGDALVVMTVNGLPRLGGDRHEYTEAEIASATFTFALWTIPRE